MDAGVTYSKRTISYFLLISFTLVILSYITGGSIGGLHMGIPYVWLTGSTGTGITTYNWTALVQNIAVYYLISLALSIAVKEIKERY